MTDTIGDNLEGLWPEICKTIQEIHWGNVYATKAIHHTIKNHQDWTEKQKAMFSETVYDLIRWWRTLWYIIDTEPSSHEQDLRKLLTVYQFSKKGDASALQEETGLNPAQVHQRNTITNTTRVLRESIPDWLDAVGQRELGHKWDIVIAALNKHPLLTIRVNTLKTTPQHLTSILHKERVFVEPVPENPDALVIKQKTNVFRLASFTAGLFEVQDAASQMVSRVLNPHPGLRVIDACAGEGSKTLHLAALMRNKGKIIALDTEEWRLKQLRKRATKAGADTIETRLVRSSKVIKRMKNTADRLLLDVPCSGLGTLRRNPDIKWKLTMEGLERLRALQQDLLGRYSPMVAPRGTMVYSVCSILPSEGEQQIQRFLRTYDTFRLLEEKRYGPETDHTDGFYIAHLERTT